MRTKGELRRSSFKTSRRRFIATSGAKREWIEQKNRTHKFSFMPSQTITKRVIKHALAGTDILSHNLLAE